MYMLVSNPCLDKYGYFSTQMETYSSLAELILYGNNYLGKEWSEYCIFRLSVEDSIPAMVLECHKQAPLRKHHYLNKRKKPCSNEPTPLSDPNPLSLSPLQDIQQVFSNWQLNMAVASQNTPAGTVSFSDSVVGALTQSEAQSF